MPVEFYLVNILCILFIVVIHEYGHFFFAKRYGVIPPKFSVGFGPEIMGFNHSGTRFSLSMIPLGGYVLFKEGTIELLPKWQKIKVYLAGPLANLLLCIVMAVIAILMGLMPEQMRDLPLIMQIVVAIIGTTVIFIVAVPLTAYALFDLLLHPIDRMEEISGPIAIFSGKAIPEQLFTGLGYGGQAVITIWMISLALGTINLVPISILDGGQIFRELFSKYPRFTNIWERSTTVLFIALIIYVIGTDIIKMAGINITEIF